MRGEVFHRPDEARLRRLLDEQGESITGVVLCLAWRAGLSRAELYGLTWDAMDEAEGVLRLPDREVPLDKDAAACLRRWRALSKSGEEPGYVLVSRRTGKRVTEPAISRLARQALDAAGMTEVRLADLRHDFVRRMLERYDWAYAIRVSGISVSTYRAKYEKGDGHGAAAEPGEDAGFRLWSVMQGSRSGAAGIALWLAQNTGLTLRELVTLTWEDADLEKGVLNTPEGSVTLIREVIELLRAEKLRRKPEDDPHILLTARSRRPMDAARLSTLLRDLLSRGGLDGALDDLRHADRLRTETERLLQRARAEGSITRAEAETLLGVSAGVARGRLAALVAAGKLARVGRAYIPAELAVPREEWQGRVLRYAAEHGGVYGADAAALLRIGRNEARALLRDMTEQGMLEQQPGSRKYLPTATILPDMLQ